MMEQAVDAQVQNYNNSSTSPCILHGSTHIASNKTKEIFRVGDIWIPHSTRSPNHFTKFFIPGIEVLFQIGDKIFRIEASNLSPQLVCWRLWQNVEFQQSQHLDNSNEQTFSPFPITFQDVVPIIKECNMSSLNRGVQDKI
jgi:hypothetical protein